MEDKVKNERKKSQKIDIVNVNFTLLSNNTFESINVNVVFNGSGTFELSHYKRISRNAI